MNNDKYVIYFYEYDNTGTPIQIGATIKECKNAYDGLIYFYKAVALFKKSQLYKKPFSICLVNHKYYDGVGYLENDFMREYLSELLNGLIYGGATK